MSDVTLTFGKYKGRPLDEVPTAYLVWALDNLRRIRYSDREHMIEELSCRQDWVPPRLRTRNLGLPRPSDN